VSSHKGRLLLLDLETMSLRHELAIQNHEPHPVEELYPTLIGARQPCTDILYFRRFGDTIVSIYRRHSGSSLEGWEDSLLLFATKLIR